MVVCIWDLHRLAPFSFSYGSMFSVVAQAPNTEFVIFMEMGDNHSILLPLMATSFITYVISSKIRPKQLYKTFQMDFYRISNHLV